MKWALNKFEEIEHISSAARGLECEAHCLICGEDLVAKKGEIREHHYAHASGRSDCPIEPESILHRYGKQVISQAMRLKVPASEILSAPIDCIFNSIREEVRLSGMQPDLVGETGDGEVYIEIAVTSFVDALKREVIIKAGVPTLEIDLSQFAKKDFDPVEVRDLILNGDEKKSWIVPLKSAEPASALEEAPPIITKPDWSEEPMHLHGMPIWVRIYLNGYVYVRTPFANDRLIRTMIHLRGMYQGKWIPGKKWSRFLPFASSRVLSDLRRLAS